MTVYIALLILIGLFSALVSLTSKTSLQRNKAQTGFSVIVGSLLIIVLALRGHGVGVDVEQYLGYWYAAETSDLTEVSRFEPSFVAITEVSRFLTDSPQFYLALVALLSIVPVMYAINKLSSRPLFSWAIYICLGFYAFTFSGLRQAIAFGITTLAIHFIRQRKLTLFLLSVGLASTFHVSALVFIPAYWIYRLRVGPIVLTVYVTLLPILFLFREQIFRWITQRYYSSYEVSHSSAYNWLLLSSAILLFSWLLVRNASNDSENIVDKRETIGMLQIATIGVTIMLFASVGTNVMRVADYYYVAIIFALPAAIERVPEQSQPLVKGSVMGGLVCVYVVQLMQSPYAIVPYTLFAG